jgi:glycine dehydrogenase subunit 1
MPYIPHTPEDIQTMLIATGKNSLEELFEDIPQEVRLKREYRIPEGLTEPELVKHLGQLAARNKSLQEEVSFLGGGVYEHFIPVLVDYLTGRSEFWTAYTPYQPEASQGNLQTIFEYQTAICELTGMDVSNASLYDGASALAEALLVAYAHHRQKRNVFLLSSSLHPDYREVAATYMRNFDVKLVDIPSKEGVVDAKELQSLLHEKVAAVAIASPNFYGLIEDGASIASVVHEKGALLISVVNPISLAILEPPGKYGADIAIGDGQPLGISVGYGGPSFGFFAAKKDLLRKMPGRIVGETVDGRGERGFVLTLQTREQHIRRENATSNICTNEALMALRSLIYLVCLGKEGFWELASQCVQKSHYLANEIVKLPGYSLTYKGPFFHEFVVTCPKPAATIVQHLQKNGIYGGLSMERWFPDRKNELLIAVTECRTRQEMDVFIENLRSTR